MLTGHLTEKRKKGVNVFRKKLKSFSSEKKEGSDRSSEERRITMLIKMKELSSTAFDVEDADLLKVEIEKALAQEEKRITEYLSDLD